ncbi:hypothetical protein CSAL01_03872 [Colletotrichum salicis]|uniref:Uncharacterized protein n=1 Tax=Colletotrichum salicis TaxID=1209931 RepID=A0A135UUZ0_9PEZI|nr:hypothetical protein CSAL01_03872 [Colletotrichum salicis]
MIEHGVTWADDQDPFGHIMNAGFSHFESTCSFRMFESFEAQLGGKVDELLNATGIGIICAIRLGEVRPDRYSITATTWSLQQQAPAAESSGWVVFFDYRKGKIANLMDIGGVYRDLHEALAVKCQRMKETAAAWEKANSPKRQSKL